jgi:hypothetical protein
MSLTIYSRNPPTIASFRLAVLQPVLLCSSSKPRRFLQSAGRCLLADDSCEKNLAADGPSTSRLRLSVSADDVGSPDAPRRFLVESNPAEADVVDCENVCWLAQTN